MGIDIVHTIMVGVVRHLTGPRDQLVDEFRYGAPIYLHLVFEQRPLLIREALRVFELLFSWRLRIGIENLVDVLGHEKGGVYGFGRNWGAIFRGERFCEAHLLL